MSQTNAIETRSAEIRPRPGRVRVRTLLATRWSAVVGQVVTLLLVSEGFGIELPMIWAMAAVACSVVLNIWIQFRRSLAGWHSEQEAAMLLGYDIVQLSVLLYLTGGLVNPFSLLLIVPVTISATILSLASTASLTLLACFGASFLMFRHQPLAWPAPGFAVPEIYVFGIWAALVLGMLFLTLYAWRVAEESRRMSDALAETQRVLAREQEISSLGALAAAAAHELGTPLGTIALIGRELADDLPAGDPMAEDMSLLNSQVARCRDILTRLARDPSGEQDLSFSRLPFRALLAGAIEPAGRASVEVRLETVSRDGAGEPVVARRAELLQGLGNLLDNAVDFARTEVGVTASWSEDEVACEILDDGPGFAPEILTALGEPYVGTRRDRGRMGLGVFIAKTLLERTGGTLDFANRGREWGASVRIRWPRERIEEKLETTELGGVT